MSVPPSVEGSQGEGTSAQNAAEIGPGSVLGKYRVTKKLGEGGMGVVFAGLHEKLGRSVAIKILRRDLCESAEQLMRFEVEAKLVTKIGHANIVAVYDFGRISDGSLYYVMEVLAGESMRKRLERGPLSDSEISAVFSQLLSAVKAAHDVGAVHRDLKPDNVMLIGGGPDEPPLVKLLDFGVAKIRGETSAPVEAGSSGQFKETLPGGGAMQALHELAGGGASEGQGEGPSPDQVADGPKTAHVPTDSLATAAGAIMGTPAYMAPEQIKGAAKVDQRADIYAIGIMLFEALIGKRPFTGNSFGELMAQHLFEEPAAPSVVHLDMKLPSRAINWDKLDVLVKRTLAKEPGERYPDCGTLLTDLESLFGKRRYASMNSLPDLTQMEAAHSAANQLEQAKRKRQRLVRIGAGVAGLVVVAAVAVKLMSGPKERVVDLGKVRQRAAQVIKEKRTTPQGLTELMAAVTLTHNRVFLPVVEEALAHEKSEVWRGAVMATQQICQPSDEDMRQALAGVADEAVGAMAVDVAMARQKCGDGGSKTILLNLAGAPALDDVSRLRAVLALSVGGHVSSTALRSAFGKALRGGEIPPELRRNILVQLLNMKDAEAQKQVESAAGNPAAELTGDDKQRRLEALQAMALSHQPRAGDFLYSAAKRSGGDDHVELALALAESGDSWAPKLVRPLLNDPSPKLRARAAAALGWVAKAGKWQEGQNGLAAAVEPLLSDKDPQVVLTAAVLLADAETVAATSPPSPPGGSGKPTENSNENSNENQ